MYVFVWECVFVYVFVCECVFVHVFGVFPRSQTHRIPSYESSNYPSPSTLIMSLEKPAVGAGMYTERAVRVST